jgi:hypothetical protein
VSGGKQRRNARQPRGKNVPIFARKFAFVRDSVACGILARLVENG